MANRHFKYVFNNEIVDYRIQDVVVVTVVNVCFAQGEEVWARRCSFYTCCSACQPSWFWIY